MIKWWPIYGLRHRLTEQKAYPVATGLKAAPIQLFRRSLFIYVIDVGAANALNFEIEALQAPQYNIHRFGIYFTDSPRHADVLIILGRPVKEMLQPLSETIEQLSRPFFIITIEDGTTAGNIRDYPQLPNHIAALQKLSSPSELLGLLLTLTTLKTKKK